MGRRTLTIAAIAALTLTVAACTSSPGRAEHQSTTTTNATTTTSGPTTTTTRREHRPPPIPPRVFDGIIIVEPPPPGYQPRVSKEEVLARYTGTSTLAGGASRVTVFLGTVTDTGYTRHGRPIIDHRVVWVLYALGVQEVVLGCGLLGQGSSTTRPSCPSSVSARLVEIVSPVSGDMINATEY
jgi:hypothetical protein